MPSYREIKYGFMGYYKKTTPTIPTLKEIDSLISDYQESLRKNHVISSEAKPAERILAYYHDQDGDKIMVYDDNELSSALHDNRMGFVLRVLVGNLDEKVTRELNAEFMTIESRDHKHLIFKIGRER